MNKKANIGKLLASIGLGAGGAGIAYSLGQHLDYNPTEKLLSLMSGGMGGAAIPYLTRDMNAAKMVKAMPLLIAAEMAPAGLRGIRAMIESQKAKESFSNNPIVKYVAPAALAGAGLATVPALINISRAADRIGDGKSIRLSTSIRKRPNDPSDLKLVIMSPDEAEAEQRQAEEEKARQEKNKGFLNKFF
mgnify:CR=1 FL=1